MSLEHRFFIDHAEIVPNLNGLANVFTYVDWTMRTGKIDPDKNPPENFIVLAKTSGRVEFAAPDPDTFVDISKLTPNDVKAWVDAELDYDKIKADLEAEAMTKE